MKFLRKLCFSHSNKSVLDIQDTKRLLLYSSVNKQNLFKERRN